MRNDIIERKNKGIEILEKAFNMKLSYSAEHNVFAENNDVVMEEAKSIDIITEINDIALLDDFIHELKKTDIYYMFERIEIKLNIDYFHNTDEYMIMRIGEEFYNEKREWIRKETYSAIIKK